MKHNLCEIIRYIFKNEFNNKQELRLCDILAPFSEHMLCKELECHNCPVGTGSHYINTQYIFNNSYLRIL